MYKVFFLIILIASSFLFFCNRNNKTETVDTSSIADKSGNITDKSLQNIKKTDMNIKLPAPVTDGEMSLEKAISLRRSVRNYKNARIKLSELSQLLWAGQGITDKSGNFRAVPSAGALYPLEIYIYSGNVEELENGIYKYSPENHELFLIISGDKNTELVNKIYSKDWLVNAPLFIVIAGVYERTAVKYGERAKRYVHMESGHSAQNICLQATALGLASLTIGAFDDESLHKLTGMEKNEQPLYIIPVGKK